MQEQRRKQAPSDTKYLLFLSCCQSNAIRGQQSGRCDLVGEPHICARFADPLEDHNALVFRVSHRTILALVERLG
jgi:hypothetical protein